MKSEDYWKNNNIIDQDFRKISQNGKKVGNLK